MSKPRETMNFTVSFRDRQDRDSFLWVHANFVKQLNDLAFSADGVVIELPNGCYITGVEVQG